MENSPEEVEILETSGIIQQQDMAAYDIQISTAKRYPRNITKATNDALVIATLDKETAESCHYSVPRGGKSITGPSVNLAKILMQNWGNMRAEAKVIGYDNTHVTSEAICFDLETNIAIKVQVKRSIRQNESIWNPELKKSEKTGKTIRMNDDMITVTGNAANSIALRNAIYAVIPRGVVNKVYGEVKKMIIGDVSTETKLIARRKQVIDALKDTYNVTEEEILRAIGRAAVTQVTPEDIATLIGIGTAIKEGDTTVELAFRRPPGNNEPAVNIDDLKELYEMKKEGMKPADVKDAERIITNLEEKSYVKLHAKLMAL